MSSSARIASAVNDAVEQLLGSIDLHEPADQFTSTLLRNVQPYEHSKTVMTQLKSKLQSRVKHEDRAAYNALMSRMVGEK